MITIRKGGVSLSEKKFEVPLSMLEMGFHDSVNGSWCQPCINPEQMWEQSSWPHLLAMDT